LAQARRQSNFRHGQAFIGRRLRRGEHKTMEWRGSGAHKRLVKYDRPAREGQEATPGRRVVAEYNRLAPALVDRTLAPRPRPRAPRAAGSRRRGSRRRTPSRSAGGGDPDPGEPEPPSRRRSDHRLLGRDHPSTGGAQ
jgi:hypothetical protein